MTGAEYWATRPKAACAFKLNGEYIEDIVPEYRTLEVSGRHEIEAEVDSYDIATGGAGYVSSRTQTRTIIVRFAVKAESTAALHKALDGINGILRAEQSQIIFDDDPDYYYIGTRTRVVFDEFLPTSASGTISIFCADPYKYSVRVYEEVADASGIITVSYGGTVPTAPVFKAIVHSDAGGVAFAGKGASVIAGDLEQDDGETVKRPETLVTTNFVMQEGLSGWAQGASTTIKTVSEGGIFELAGSNGFDDGGLYADAGSGNYWHGPSYQLAIPPDHNGDVGASSFGCTIDVDFASTSSSGNDQGRLYMMFNAGDATNGYSNVFRAELYKADIPSRQAELRLLDMDGMVLATQKTSIANDELRNTSITVSKLGGTLIFISSAGALNVSVPGIESTEVTQVELVMAKYAAHAAFDIHVQTFRLVKYEVDEWRDLPNLFADGDEVTVDCGEYGIEVNGVSRPDIGDINNDFDGMALAPGLNTIQCTTNEWATPAPSYSVTYREVFT